jgi:regulator of protease activity HflC (stomatin/prohibitin superfamily)
VLVGLAIAVIFARVKIVPQGHRFTVKRFGKYARTLQLGLHIILPMVDRIGNKVKVVRVGGMTLNVVPVDYSTHHCLSHLIHIVIPDLFWYPENR